MATSVAVSPLAEDEAAKAAGALASGHLHQLDLLRLLTFAAVIAVHSLAFTQTDTARGAAAVMMPLQFTREVFFALTAVVLTWTYRNRPLRLGAFYRQRVTFVAAPLLVWTLIYYLYHLLQAPGRWQDAVNWHDIWFNELLTANAEYHLYFLLVTIQLYLLFPLVLRLVRATAARWYLVLVPVTALNLGWLAALHYVPQPGGWVGALLWAHSYELLPTYTMYVLAGGYLAVHLRAATTFALRHRGRMYGVAFAGIAVALGVYALQLAVGRAPRDANAVLQPAMAGPSIAAALLLYLAGCSWVRAGRPGARAIRLGSDISFGVYLAHPLILELLLQHGLGSGAGQIVPAWWATVLAYLGAAAGATAIALVARRTPLSVALAGRPRASRHAT